MKDNKVKNFPSKKEVMISVIDVLKKYDDLDDFNRIDVLSDLLVGYSKINKLSRDNIFNIIANIYNNSYYWC